MTVWFSELAVAVSTGIEDTSLNRVRTMSIHGVLTNRIIISEKK